LLALAGVTMLPYCVHASHRDSGSGSWWGSTSSSIDRKIDDLDSDKVEDLKIPILLGVTVNALQDTWGDARSGGRTHEGIDIFAPRGAFIVSPTDAVVTRIDEGDLGGLGLGAQEAGGFPQAHAAERGVGVGEV